MSSKIKLLLSLVFIASLFIGAVFFANWVQESTVAQEKISSFGVLGILLVSIVGGLNLFVPVPATAFIPIFSASGFTLTTIVFFIVIGTTTADLVSYFVGTFLKPKADKINNRALNWARENCVGKPFYTGSIVFLYSAFVPLPNEILLLPLGSLGMKLRNLIGPFILGTFVHVGALAYGLTFFI